MKYSEDFAKFVKQKLGKEPPLNGREKIIKQTIHEIDALELLGDSFIVWLN